MIEMMKEQSGDYEHRLWFTPANGGHNMELHFAVVGPKGAVNLSFYTHWFLEAQRAESQETFSKALWGAGYLCKPKGTDVGMHSRTPIYQENEKGIANCHLLDGATCYYDGGSSILAEDWEEGFIAGGLDWLWPRLEQLYRCRFDGEQEFPRSRNE